MSANDVCVINVNTFIEENLKCSRKNQFKKYNGDCIACIFKMCETYISHNNLNHMSFYSVLGKMYVTM